MTETQQRFLRAIAERVAKAQVVEVHLFPPIRQGGVETGVAVVAEDPRLPVVIPIEGSTPIDEIDAQADGAEVLGDGPLDLTTLSRSAEASDQGVRPLETESDDHEVPSLEMDDPSPYADEPVAASDDAEPHAEPVEPEPQADGDGIGSEDADVAAAAPTPPPRYTIHTARYRLTLKGVDRGKWEVDVVAEADAPLDAVDKVVRGVQRRSGEGAEPDRLTSETFLEALDAPLATLER